ncbi:MAG: type pilus assembly protein PilA [Actinomycetota bacterium]|nr:type pilus assembly protein PilA [Actinomycetota bacterium]
MDADGDSFFYTFVSCPRKGASKVLSIRSFVSRKRDSEEGFTLIELMVVVLIIAILIAIAIPQFLGARSRAQDRAAQSSLRNALTAAKTAYTDQSNYATATESATTGLPLIEPSLKYVAAGTSSADIAAAGTAPAVPSFKVVSLSVTSQVAGDNQVWSAAVLSKSGTCYWIKDIATGTGTAGTFYGTTAGPTCTGTAALGATNASW